jgi:hypothetical protein
VLIFSNEKSISQNIEIPTITSVGINQTTGNPVISWTVQHPELIDGYIVKRLIYQFPGVVDFSYNSVAQINDPNVFSFDDNSVVYGNAKPNERTEIYRVVAFKNNGGQILLSPMSSPVKSIFVTAKFNFCKKNITIRWNRETQSTENYLVLKSVNNEIFRTVSTQIDTFFEDFQIETDSNYFYKIVRNEAGTISESNICLIFSKGLQAPKFLKSQCAVVDSGKTNLVFEADTAGETTDFVLLHAQNSFSQFDTMAVIPFQYQTVILFSDIQSPVNQQNYYVLAARDFCKSEMLRSDTLQNIVLNVETNDKTNILTWNRIKDSAEFQIYRSAENSVFSVIGNSAENSYTDNISPLYAEQFQNGNQSKEVCYYIFVKVNTNICNSESSEICIQPEEKIFVPTALNPKSTTEENQTFKPKLAFTKDYTLSVYSRNGTLVFETHNSDIGWTGCDSGGKLLPIATYMYFLKFKNTEGKNIVKSGYVSLVY